MGPRLRSAATVKDMAMRWSPWASTVPPAKGCASPPLPSMRMPSGSTVTGRPTAARPSAITWMRSDSFTRSSSAPRSSVTPSAQAAAMKSAGNSSMASGTQAGSMVMPLRRPPRTCRSATGSPPTSCGLDSVMSAPMARSTCSTPVRVGFMPT